MEKLTLPPNESFSLSDREQCEHFELEGGRARVRLSMLEESQLATLEWVTDRRGFEYLQAFYNKWLFLDCESFTIDLPISGVTLTEVDAVFIPDSFGLKAQSGLRFTVGCQIEIGEVPTVNEFETPTVAPFEISFFRPPSSVSNTLDYQNSGSNVYVSGAYRLGVDNLAGGETIVWAATWFPVNISDAAAGPVLASIGGIGDAVSITPQVSEGAIAAGTCVISATVNGVAAKRAQITFSGGASSLAVWGPTGS